MKIMLKTVNRQRNGTGTYLEERSTEMHFAEPSETWCDLTKIHKQTGKKKDTQNNTKQNKNKQNKTKQKSKDYLILLASDIEDSNFCQEECGPREGGNY